MTSNSQREICNGLVLLAEEGTMLQGMVDGLIEIQR
jgi:hypothetical protein